MGLLSTIRTLLGRAAGDSTAGARRPTQSSFVDPHLPTERCIVDNRVLLLGLDQLYREAMQPHERGELLSCARTVAEILSIMPAPVPAEGYYAEDPHLTEYFSLMRALQETAENRTAEVAALPEFRRLLQVSSAPLYGRPVQREKLLPVGRDALSEALRATVPWTVERLTTTACAAAREADDISLVGLAARVQDSVVLAALRESVVLYGEMVVGALPPTREFLWQVDDELAKGARRFVDTFNALFDDDLPAPIGDYAAVYWAACEQAGILGRCVRLGESDTQPGRYYHWAICRALDGQLAVQEVWDQQIWTTERYRGALQLDGRCPEL
jgi:hypothetical protein